MADTLKKSNVEYAINTDKIKLYKYGKTVCFSAIGCSPKQFADAVIPDSYKPNTLQVCLGEWSDNGSRWYIAAFDFNSSGYKVVTYFGGIPAQPRSAIDMTSTTGTLYCTATWILA